MKSKKIALKDIQIDKRLTELRPVNSAFVSRYRQAYRVGANMPLITIDEKTNKIVSGNHRYSAMLAEYSLDYQTEVNTGRYKNWQEILKQFTLENTTCGNPLTGISRKLIADELVTTGMSDKEIAEIFNIPENRLTCWRAGDIKVVSVKQGNVIEKRFPAKRGLETEVRKAKEIGQEITLDPVQYKEHLKLDRSADYRQKLFECCRWHDNDCVAYTNDNMEALQLFKKKSAVWEKEFAKRMKAAA